MKKLMLLLIFSFLSGTAWADEQMFMQAIVNAKTPEEKGLAIAKMAEFRDKGWKDSESKMLMILRDRQGQESRRDMRSRSLEVENDGDKGLSIFDSPPDVKGTALLTWSHALEPDDQWIYLPALKRVKRISSQNKSGPFMGSEFAYEDMASPEIEKYTYKYLRDEKFEGVDCYVVESYPAYEHSGYTRQVGWVDKERFIPLKTVYYDRKNALLKTLIFKGYKQHLNKHWRPTEMFMDNHQTGKSTTLELSNLEFRKGFTDRDFDQNTLSRTY